MYDPLELSDALITAGIRAGFEVIQYGEEFAYPLLALQRSAGDGAPRVYLSSGVHGDEPAPIHALRHLIASGSLPRELNLTICPIVNPSGFAAGTRENANGLDLNRDFKFRRSLEITTLTRFLDRQPPFDLSICLHEDWEATGFYTYYIGERQTREASACIISAVSKVGQIEPMELIDGYTARDGVIHPPDNLRLSDREDWPEAYYLYSKSHHPHFTFESPSSLPLDQRVAMQIAAVNAALAFYYGRD